MCLAQNRHLSSRNVIRTVHLSNTPTPGTCTPSLTRPTSFSSDPLLGELQPCADLRQLERGSLAEPQCLKSYEPKDHKLFTEDKHLSKYQNLAEHGDLHVKPPFFHQPSIAFDLRFCGEYRDTSSGLRIVLCWLPTERPGALLCSSKNRLNPETKNFLKRSTCLGNNERLFRFSNPETSVKSILEGHTDHMLAEAKSEIMKQECKVDSLNTWIRELQRQAHSQRLELDDANCGYEESRREQIRLEEELALREHPLNRPSPLLCNTASEGKSEHELTWVLDLTFQHETLKVWRIYQTEAPIFTVFAVQPWGSVEFPMVGKNHG